MSFFRIFLNTFVVHLTSFFAFLSRIFFSTNRRFSKSSRNINRHLLTSRILWCLFSPKTFSNSSTNLCYSKIFYFFLFLLEFFFAFTFLPLLGFLSLFFTFFYKPLQCFSKILLYFSFSFKKAAYNKWDFRIATFDVMQFRAIDTIFGVLSL